MVTRTNAVVINGFVVSEKQHALLKSLVGLKRPATISEIINNLAGKWTYASAYTLLRRLVNDKKLLIIESDTTIVRGTSYVRQVYCPVESVIKYFDDEKRKNSPPDRGFTNEFLISRFASEQFPAWINKYFPSGEGTYIEAIKLLEEQQEKKFLITLLTLYIYLLEDEEENELGTMSRTIQKRN
jgi:hypothetical protein